MCACARQIAGHKNALASLVGQTLACILEPELIEKILSHLAAR